MRNVECNSADGGLSNKCDPLTKPASVQRCTTGLLCDSSSGIGPRVSSKMIYINKTMKFYFVNVKHASI